MRAARDLVEQLEAELAPLVKRVEDGRFVRDVLAGSFPLSGIHFVQTNRYHALTNDLANLNLFVARARDEDEMLFFHSMATEGQARRDAHHAVTDALGLERNELAGSEPSAVCLVRTNYFSRLAQYGTAGEIALATLVSSSISAAGASAEARGLREHYGLDEPVPAAADFRTGTIDSIARDLGSGGHDERLSQTARWTAEYEAMVWDAFHDEGASAKVTA